MSLSVDDLTDDERWRLANPHAASWADAADHRDPSADGVPVTCHRCAYRWVYTGEDRRANCPVCNTYTQLTDDREPAERGLTTPMCHAIREAAHDGQSYGEIARLFTFVGCRAAASHHARGDCQHDGAGVPPVDGDRDGGFGHGKLDAAGCADLRERYADGEFDSYAAAGRAVGVHRTTAATHIKGECSHGGGGPSAE